MTIKELKKKIENLPDDMRIYADDGNNGMFSNNSEFVTLVTGHKNMCVMQTEEDFDVNEELRSWYKEVTNGNIEEDIFWKEFYELGYDYDDFDDSEMQEKALEYKKRRQII